MSCGDRSQVPWYAQACGTCPEKQEEKECGCTIVEIPASVPVLLGTRPYTTGTGTSSWTIRLSAECPVIGTNQFTFTPVIPTTIIPGKWVNRTADGNTACWNTASCPDRICVCAELNGTETTTSTTAITQIGPFRGCLCFYNCAITGILQGMHNEINYYYVISGAYTECREGCMSRWVVSYISIDGRNPSIISP
jgi:hypothetical protein